MNNRLFYLLISLLSVVLAACNPPAATPPPAARGTFVSVTSSTSLPASTVTAYIDVFKNNYGVDTSTLIGNRYDISIQRIVYKTMTPDGRLIDASGLIAHPKKLPSATSPILSYQHGTLFQDSEAPSMMPDNNLDPVMIILAGSGFIVTLPDYIGYAASTNEIHPYLNAKSLAGTTVDLLRATRQFLASQHIQNNQQLFLIGYSEGGYATLATQQEIEQRLAGEFSVTASSPAAGPYNMSFTVNNMLSLTSNPYTAYLGFIFKSYDYWYGWNAINSVFNSPYNTVISNGYDGSFSLAGLNSVLSTDSATLFKSAFRTEYLGAGQLAVKADIAINDIYNWAPQAPTHLFHGQADAIVPYANATSAKNAMRNAGSTSVTVVDCAATPPDHANCFFDYLSQTLVWMVPLAENR